MHGDQRLIPGWMAWTVRLWADRLPSKDGFGIVIPLCIKIYGRVDAWTRGRVDAWTRGRVDAWTQRFHPDRIIPKSHFMLLSSGLHRIGKLPSARTAPGNSFTERLATRFTENGGKLSAHEPVDWLGRQFEVTRSCYYAQHLRYRTPDVERLRLHSRVSKQPGSHAYKRATAKRLDIPNRLNREFDVPGLDQLWCGDITYIWAQGKGISCL
jgi:hypothetical protein